MSVLNDFKCPICGHILFDVECRSPEFAPECLLCGGTAMKKQYNLNLIMDNWVTRERTDRWERGPMKMEQDHKAARHHMETNGVPNPRTYRNKYKCGGISL